MKQSLPPRSIFSKPPAKEPHQASVRPVQMISVEQLQNVFPSPQAKRKPKVKELASEVAKIDGKKTGFTALRLSADIMERLDAYCQSHGMTRSEAIRVFIAERV